MNTENTETRSKLSSPEQWVAQYGDYLFRFAMLKLRDEHLAEDAVQETLLAALQGQKNFSGASAEKNLAGRHPQAQDCRFNPQEGARANAAECG